MASSQTRSDRGYHQDYIARIRYSNALPPPPIPPKLLEIPNTGLAGGDYTSASFASRLAREQPLNIEADAELGMSIDLVGIPGIFEGDESAIYASGNPELHAKDRALLRPLASLGKPSASGTGVSFLRRTEYITSAYQGTPSATRTDPVRSSRSTPNRQRKRRFEADKEKPENIAKGIIKGFDVAYPADSWTGADEFPRLRGAEVTNAEKEAWSRPRHPRKAEVKLVDAYPLLPDWDAYPPPEESMPMAFGTFKFLSNPVPSNDRYDERLDVGLLQQKELSAEEREKAEMRAALWKKDPVNNKRYLPKADYYFFLPDQGVNVQNVKRKFDAMDPDRDDDALYGNGIGEDDDLGLDDEKTSFRYPNIRTYETSQQQANIDDVFETVALSLHDPDPENPEGDRLKKGAYFYPISQRTQIRQKVKKHNVMTAALSADDELNRLDAWDVKVRAPNDDEQEALRNELASFDTPLE